MSVEKNGLIHYIDQNGNEQILYPVTKKENVQGMDEVEQSIVDERIRAEQAEAGLKSDIASEQARAIQAEELNSDAISEESERAKAIEKSLSDDISTKLDKYVSSTRDFVYIATFDGNQAMVELSPNVASNAIPKTSSTGTLSVNTPVKSTDAANKGYVDEIESALSSDIRDLNSSIQSEISDRKTSDDTLTQKIEVEKQRALQAEQKNASDILTESDRAKGIESELNAAIITEKQRAQEAESSLSTRITTAQDTADTAESIARGRAQTKTFNTVSDMNEWLSNADNVATLNVGDNLYIVDTGVPDYWWTGSGVAILETEKVDLTDYYTKTQTDSQIALSKQIITSETDTKINTLSTEVNTALNEYSQDLSELSTNLNLLDTFVGVVNDDVQSLQQNVSVLGDTVTTLNSNITDANEDIQNLNSSKYEKPETGIPESDLSVAVQNKLNTVDYITIVSGATYGTLSESQFNILASNVSAYILYADGDSNVPYRLSSINDLSLYYDVDKHYITDGRLERYQKNQIQVARADRHWNLYINPTNVISSVNGKTSSTGAVTLNASDVGAVGVAKASQGKNITINADTELSWDNVIYLAVWNDTTNEIAYVPKSSAAAGIGAMPISGGKFTGRVGFSNGAALPNEGALPYFLGIQAFADGGEMIYRTASNVLGDLGGMPKSGGAFTGAVTSAVDGNGFISHSDEFNFCANLNAEFVTVNYRGTNQKTIQYYQFCNGDGAGGLADIKAKNIYDNNQRVYSPNNLTFSVSGTTLTITKS